MEQELAALKAKLAAKDEELREAREARRRASVVNPDNEANALLIKHRAQTQAASQAHASSRVEQKKRLKERLALRRDQQKQQQTEQSGPAFQYNASLGLNIECKGDYAVGDTVCATAAQGPDESGSVAGAKSLALTTTH